MQNALLQDDEDIFNGIMKVDVQQYDSKQILIRYCSLFKCPLGKRRRIIII